ncbi:MAG: hypothetical protein AAGD92_03255 [Pseudomonadota bacterium]
MRSETSNRNLRDGLAGGVAQTKMVDPHGPISNIETDLFDTLEEWDSQLQHVNPKVWEISP